MKRFIAAFIFIFLWGWFYNGVLLKDVFAEAQGLFRPREEVMGLFHWIVIGQALLISRSWRFMRVASLVAA